MIRRAVKRHASPAADSRRRMRPSKRNQSRDLVTSGRSVWIQEQDVLTVRVCGEMVVSSPKTEVSCTRENPNVRKFPRDEVISIVA